MVAKKAEMKFENLIKTGQYIHVGLGLQANKRFEMAIQTERKTENRKTRAKGQ